MSAKSLFNKVIDSLANLAIFIDMIIRELGKRVLESLPEKLQVKLNLLNDSYKSHRNKLLGINETPKVLVGSHVNANSCCSAHPTSHPTSHSTSTPGSVTSSSNNENMENNFQREDSSNSEVCNIDAERSLQRGDVPGWVLVVLMTTGLVTALWTIAAPRLSQILRNSLDSMNSIR